MFLNYSMYVGGTPEHPGSPSPIQAVVSQHRLGEARTW